MSKNLTGNKRIIKDACIDLYNAVQKWISFTSESHSTILSICMLRQKELSDDELLNQDLLDDSTFTAVSPEMLLLSSQLKLKLKNLETVTEKMRKVSKKLRSIRDLSELELSHRGSITESFDVNPNTEPILFQSWPISRFCEASEEIKKMHLKELRVKLNLVEELHILTHKSELIFCESYWKYEPYINRDRVNELLEAILSELELQ